MESVGRAVDDEQHSDVAVWTAACSGDTRAFERLYLDHADAVFLFCLRRLVSFQDAEDVVARTFEALWKQRKDVRCDSTRGLRPWLYTVARRLCMRTPNNVHLVATVPERAVDFGTDVVAEDVINGLAAQALLDAIARLDERDRVLATHSFVDELTSLEIGRRLGMPGSTVRSKLSRIKDRLEAELKDAGFGPESAPNG